MHLFGLLMNYFGLEGLCLLGFTHWIYALNIYL